MKKVIATALASVLLAGQAFAADLFTINPLYPGQTVSIAVSASNAPTSLLPTFVIGNATGGVIDSYQAGSTGLPAGTQSSINNFQTSAGSAQQSIAGGNPSPGTSLPAGFTVGFATGNLPLVK